MGLTIIVARASNGVIGRGNALPWRLPEDLAHLELKVVPESGSAGAPQFRFVLRESSGTSVKMSALAWEPLVPGPDPHVAVFRHARLNATGIRAACRSFVLAGRGVLVSKPIPTSIGFLNGPTVVKAIGTDALGRRVAAWAELPGVEISRGNGDATEHLRTR